MKVLVIGGGGREHALAWKLSKNATEVFVYPGNPGMNLTAEIQCIPLQANQKDANFDFALQVVKEYQIDFVVIGPKKYLFDGWVDQFAKNSIPAFGPSLAASFLESSKIKAKQFMREWRIPTAPFEIAHNLGQAINAIDAHPEWLGYVLKLSEPSLGKGVVVTHSRKEAMQVADQFFQHRPAGIEEGMVIEALQTGPEVSVFYACLEDRYRLLATACDHKRLKDHDEGPNTGGMGAYSPASWLSDQDLYRLEKDFVIPTLLGMNDRGTPFRGILFLGIMMTPQGPSLLEYNTRFGDPETQTFLPLLKGDFCNLLHAVATRDRHEFKVLNLETSLNHAVHVVKAAKGYPGMFGEPIEKDIKIVNHLEKISAHTQVFFAGVSEATHDSTANLVTSGGRVFGMTTVAPTIKAAREQVYQDLKQVHFENEHYRSDIGERYPERPLT